MAETIDDEVHSLIDTAYDRAKSLLIERRDKLAALAEYLMEHETADAPDLEKILGKPPVVDKLPHQTFIGSPAPATE